MSELRSRSAVDDPWCLKCGSRGHVIAKCRNAQLCFVCNGFGHKARLCTSNIVATSPSPKQRLILSTPKPRNHQIPIVGSGSRPHITSPMAYRASIVQLEATERSRAVEAILLQSFVLDDIAAWGPDCIERGLQREFPHHRHLWIASIFDDYKYLIQSPNSAWLESMASVGFLRLDDVKFSIVAWEKEFHEGMPLEVVWVRVYGFPLFMNDQVEYDKIFNPWGAYVLEIDAGTHSGYDVQFVRLKLEICDRALIPVKQKVPYKNPEGKRALYDLEIDIETEKSENLHAWASRKAGRPYPNGTEFGSLPVPPPPPPPTGGQGGGTRQEGGFVFNGNNIVLRGFTQTEGNHNILVEEQEEQADLEEDLAA